MWASGVFQLVDPDEQFSRSFVSKVGRFAFDPKRVFRSYPSFPASFLVRFWNFEVCCLQFLLLQGCNGGGE